MSDRRQRVTIDLPLLCMIALTQLMILPPAARAAPLLRAQVGLDANTGTSGVVQQSIPTTFGSHASQARYGYLVASSEVAISDITASDNGLRATASFQDDLTITDPSATSATGTLRAQLRIVGEPISEATRSSLAVAQGISADYQVLTIRNGGTAFFVDGASQYNTSTTPPDVIVGTVPAPGSVEVEFTFSFGFPVELGLSLSTLSTGNNSFFPPETGSISGESNIFLVWEGITSIRDAADNELIDSATIVSASGTDWRVARAPGVPLGPWVAPLALVTLLGVAGVAQRVRSRSNPARRF